MPAQRVWGASMRHAFLFALVAGVVGACASPPRQLPEEMTRLPTDSLEVSVRVDSARHEVVVYAGPFHVEAIDPEAYRETGGHSDHVRSPLMEFEWPVEAHLRGFRISAVDPSDQEYPSSLMHHLIGVNFDRRQVVYPVAERLFGVGTETGDVLLPGALGVPLKKGSRLGFYASWHNDFGRDLERVYIRVALPYMEREPQLEVLPIYMDTNNTIGGSNAFDLPPGRTEKAYEFTIPVDGELVAAGGHLHDHGEELRLEDAESGEVLLRIEPKKDEEGHVVGIERKLLGPYGEDLRLKAGKRYRVVGVYENTSGEYMPMGAMAHISGIFAPDDPDALPELDPDSELYARDVSALPAPPGAGERRDHHRGGHEHEAEGRR